MTKFTKDSFIRWMPSQNSKIWDKMTTDIRTMADRGTGTRANHAILNFNPSSINSKNIQWLLALNRVETSRETREALREVGIYIAEEINERFFQNEGNVTTGPWPPLTKRTLDWREKKGYPSGPILTASGTLRAYATSPAAINEIVGGVNPRVIMGGEHWPNGPEPLNLKEKFYTHMSGIDGKIPPRPFMPESEADFTSADNRQIKDIFKRHIYDLFDRAGRV